MAKMEEAEDEEGVLLYYKFVSIPDPHSLSLWFRCLCSSLALVGRIRVAPDGVNVTVGGTITSLHKHIYAVKSHPWLGGCDFKLASAHTTTICKSGIAPEVGFSSLSVRIVKELVTLGVHPSKCPSISDAGAHLSAMEFHSKIQEAENICNSLPEGTDRKEQIISMALSREQKSEVAGESDNKLFQGCTDMGMEKVKENTELVLLDARNIYETRIGRFVPPEGVDFLDPQIRQYSDLPRWIDSNSEKLRNKNILMYCTGGVRCEMASAYLRNKGKGFQNVFQLSGGIQRYLEAFPDGGFFKGKNFVFDHRIAVPSSCIEVLGTCLICGISFDDYSSRIRCSHCRMLVLICSDCQQASMSCSAQHQLYVCELCKASKTLNNDNGNDLLGHSSSELCSGKEAAQQEMSNTRMIFNEEHGASHANYGPTVRQKLRILCLHGFRQSASSLKGRLASFTKKLKGMADFVFVDAPHKVPLIFSKSDKLEDTANLAPQSKPEIEVPHRKYAWLVTPEMMLSCLDLQASPDTLIRDTVPSLRIAVEFDKDQFRKQTQGWLTSLSELERVFLEMGPFDGVLGFSQGAAVAASLCLLKESSPQVNSNVKFRFVILCSGFVSPACEVQDLMSRISLPLNFPSLHIFAESMGHDRQIVNGDSMQLTSMFNSESSVVLTHNMGHIVPSQKEYVDKVRIFLSHFI
eukprot:c15574_g1_i1 orf=75-2147(+)